jgi:hypothetical protein
VNIDIHLAIKSYDEKSNYPEGVQRVPLAEKEWPKCSETSLGASYGSDIGDAMT